MIDRTDNAKTNNLYSPPPNCWLFILDVDSDVIALLILLLLACVRRESKRMMCWGRSTCRRHQRPSPATEGSYANIRGDVPMTVVHWCSTPKRWWIIMVHHFLQWFGTERKLKKKWLLVASKPPITKLKDCPCSIYYGGELCSFRVVIYCMLAMGPGQTLWCCSSHRREKRWVSKRAVRLTQDIYPMYSHSREAQKNNKMSIPRGEMSGKKM